MDALLAGLDKKPVVVPEDHYVEVLKDSYFEVKLLEKYYVFLKQMCEFLRSSHAEVIALLNHSNQEMWKKYGNLLEFHTPLKKKDEP